MNGRIWSGGICSVRIWTVRTYALAIACLCAVALTSCTTGLHSTPTTDITPVMAVAATSGTPQSHAINAAFGAALVATVTTNGAPTSGVVVTFTAPSIGPSGTFSNTSSKTATATTDLNGIATSPAFMANGTSGAYVVTASVPGVIRPANFSLTNTTGAPASVTAISGTPQSAPINTPFAAPLVVTVFDSGQNPVSGVTVTFTAPPSEASGIFTDTASTVTTAISNASGSATSAVFTANGTAGPYTVTAMIAGVSAPANFVLTNAAGAPATITATSGTSQSAEINTAFASPLAATVLDAASNPVSGVAVTFSAPSTGASGTFANGTTTETDTTDASGAATSSIMTANGTTGGPYSVLATIAALSTPATFSLTNRVIANTYVFYLSGQESFGPNYYALAGSVEIDPSGNVLAGEQDYNDAFGFTSPEPSGDLITGGTLSVSSTTGQGTLTLITNNPALPSGGTETLAVQFVNTNHAVIMQFDGSATSAGSIDLQTSPGTIGGGYAFTLSGVDNFYGPVEFGGVFSITNSTTLENGSFDENDNGGVSMATPFSGTLSGIDSFGRGTITSSALEYSGVPIILNYYVVGPEVIRLIDVDSTDSAIGSAFGQGVNATGASNASLGTSVFGMEGTPYIINYATVGMFSTSSSAGTFSGVADDNEVVYSIQLPAAPIGGTYSIAPNGYGNFTIDAGDLGDVSLLGIYVTDPNLNLSDPNNTTSGLGGALFADLDAALPGGVGIVIPQTDTATTSFNGSYAFNAQDFNDFCCEFDFAGQGTVNKNALKGTGYLNDLFLTLGTSALNSGVTFAGTAQPDKVNVGRYSLSSTNTKPNPFKITISGTTTDFEMAIYQASGEQLFWIDEDAFSVALGSLQQQGSLTGLPVAKKIAAKGK
jgi:hypothetical protein